MSTPCLVLLCFLALWSPGQCQDIDLDTLYERLRANQAYQKALEENPDIMDEVAKAANELKKLWTDYFPELMNSLSSSNGISISPQCNSSAWAVYRDHVNFQNVSIPAMAPLLDASGKQGPGLLGGNFILDGSYDECFQYNYTGFCTGKAWISFLPPTPIGMFLWTVNLCVPKGCTSTDVALVVNSTKVLRVSESYMSCTDRKRPTYSAGAIVMIVVSAIFVCLVFLGTLVHKILEYMAASTEEPKKDYVAINDNSGVSTASGLGERRPLLAHTAAVEVKRNGCCKVKCHEFITAFSLYKTVPALLATKQNPGVITSLNGLRVISMFWVILGHAYIWIIQGQRTSPLVDNPLTLLDISSRLTFQPVGNAFLAVDSFFFLSAVLVAYLTFRQIKKRGRFPFIHYYVHRYLRLTPNYAFVLFFAWFLTQHLAPGPGFAYSNQYSAGCSKYWWSNFLYINNLYPWKMRDQCLGWTWYLANDMQFFVIAPIILIPLFYFSPIGLVIAGAFLLASFVITGTLAGVFDFQANLFASIYAYHHVPKTQQNSMDLLYEKPWARITPYIVGLLLGYVIFRGVRLPFGRVKNWPFYMAMWVFSAVLLITTCYGLYFTWHGHVPSTAENVMYLTFSRFAWALGLALMVFACHNGHGGIINTILSLKIWTPLSRLTYNAYLVHPVVLTVIYGQLQTTLHCTDITVASLTVAFVVFSYSAAAVICVCVEFPLGSVEMLLFKLVGLDGRGETQRQGGGGVVTGGGRREEEEGRERIFAQGKA